jgi:hypothetical protein
VSVRNGVAHARQRQQFMCSCQNGITIHRQPSTNIKIYTFHTSMSPAIFYSKKGKKKKEKSLSAERSGTRASTHLFFSCDINIGTFHLADIYAMFSYAWFCFSLHLVFSLKYLVGFLCVASFRSLCSVRGQIWNWSASVSTTIENP